MPRTPHASIAPVPPAILRITALPRPPQVKTYTSIQLKPAAERVPNPNKRNRNVSEVFKRRKRPARDGIGGHGEINGGESGEDEESLPPSFVEPSTSNGSFVAPNVEPSTGDDCFVEPDFEPYDASQESGPCHDPEDSYHDVPPGGGGGEIHLRTLAYSDADDFDRSFAAYVDTMAAHSVSIIQICETLFVAQGWNARYNSGTVRSFFIVDLYLLVFTIA